MTKAIKSIYETYHLERKLQPRIITYKNFTYRNLLEILLPYLKDSKKILDIGCGVGTLDFYLGSKGHSVLGIDISKNAIKIATENTKLLNLKAKLNFFCMNFPDQEPRGKFDLIIMSEILEHIKADKKALKEAHSLLKRNGVIIISVPSENAPLYRLGVLKEFDRNVGHLRRYTSGELINLVSSAGLKVETIKRTEGILRNFLFTNPYAGNLIRFIKFWISDLMTWLDDLTVFILGESQIYLVAIKK